MAIKERISQINQKLAENQISSETRSNKEEITPEDKESSQNTKTNEDPKDVYIQDKLAQKSKETGKFSEEFLKSNVIEGLDLRMSSIFSNQMFNTLSQNLTSHHKNNFNNLLDNHCLFDKNSVLSSEKKNKNIFFKTTKKNQCNDQKSKSNELYFDSKNEILSPLNAKENNREEKFFLSKKTKFKENNIDLLLCNYYIFLF